MGSCLADLIWSGLVVEIVGCITCISYLTLILYYIILYRKILVTRETGVLNDEMR